MSMKYRQLTLNADHSEYYYYRPETDHYAEPSRPSLLLLF